jgi:hypothetical protein
VLGLVVEAAVDVLLREEPRSHRDVVVAEALDHGLGAAGDDGVDAADLVAHLPAHLEEDERGGTRPERCRFSRHRWPGGRTRAKEKVAL